MKTKNLLENKWIDTGFGWVNFDKGLISYNKPKKQYENMKLFLTVEQLNEFNKKFPVDKDNKYTLIGSETKKYLLKFFETIINSKLEEISDLISDDFSERGQEISFGKILSYFNKYYRGRYG